MPKMQTKFDKAYPFLKHFGKDFIFMKAKKQIKLLLAMDWMCSFRLGGTLWVFFLIGRGFSLVEVGLAEGFFHLVSLCCEIPSGMAADVLGRKRTMLAAQIAWLLSAFCMILIDSMFGVYLAMALSALGYNLMSGTREAMSYDTLIDAGLEQEYLSLTSRQNMIWRISAGLATLFAGISVRLGYRICYGLDIVVILSTMLLVSRLYEPVVTEAQSSRELAVFRGLPQRIKSCFTGAVSFLYRNPKIAGIMLRNAVIGAFATLLGFYLQDGLSAYGAPTTLLGPLLLLVGLGGAVGAKLAPAVMQRFRYRNVLISCLAALALGYLATATKFYPLMALGGFLAVAGDDCLQTITDARLNKELPSDQRATLISVSSMMFSVIMILLSPLLGYIVT